MVFVACVAGILIELLSPPTPLFPPPVLLMLFFFFFFSATGSARQRELVPERAGDEVVARPAPQGFLQGEWAGLDRIKTGRIWC